MVPVQELVSVSTDKLLVGSSGKEFIKPHIFSNAAEVKKARKEAMGRLGLDFLDNFGDADDMDLDKELADDPNEAADMDVDGAPKSDTDMYEDKGSPLTPIDTTVTAMGAKESSPIDTSKSGTPALCSPDDDDAPTPSAGMSARELNRLKRKRKAGNNAFVSAPPPQATSAKYHVTPAAGNKCVSPIRSTFIGFLISCTLGRAWSRQRISSPVPHRVRSLVRLMAATRSSWIHPRAARCPPSWRSRRRRCRCSRVSGSGMES
jgi:hypothetical protein